MQEGANLSPNLLRGTRRNHQSEITLLKSITYTTHVLFVFVFLINLNLNKGLQKGSQRAFFFESRLNERRDIFYDVGLINQKISLYKQVLESRMTYSEFVKSVDGSLTPGTLLQSVTIREKEADVKLVSQEALTVALYISRILENESVDQVILESANLDPNDRTFEVALVLRFK